SAACQVCWSVRTSASRLLPLNAGVETIDPLGPVSIFARRQQMPNDLRSAVLGELIDVPGRAGPPGRFAELHISVFEHAGVSAEEGVVRGRLVKEESGCLSVLIHAKDRDCAKAGRLSGDAAGSTIDVHNATVVAVVEHSEREFASGIGGDKRGAMLCEEPVLGVGVSGSVRIHQNEVALITEVPEDVAGADAVVVINLYEPILVAHGDDEVAIVGGIDH